MTAEAVSPFEPIVLEDDPAFDVKKEYQDELDYYYETHPNDHGYVPPKSLKESAVGMIKGLRSGLEKVVEVRDDLYGYNDETKGPRIHLKPVEEMEFLPSGMGIGSGGNPFALGGNATPDFSLHPHSPHKKQAAETAPCHKKKSKKPKCCSCKDIGCLKNPRHCKEEQEEKHDKPSVDILSSDPFGIGRGKKLF